MDSNKQVTIAQRNYFKPGSYAAKFKQQFGNAGVANVITTTLLAPLERWRIIAQTQRGYPLRPKRFDHIFNYLTRLPKEQGIMALWRGNSTSVLIYLYQTIFQIGVYDSIKQHASKLQAEVGEDSLFSTVFTNFVYPLVASFLTLTVVHPLDTYRIHLTMRYHKDKNDALFTKLRDRFSQVNSIKDFYRGFILANIISLIHFNLYRTLYQAAGNVEIQGVPSDLVNKQLIFSLVAVGLVHPLDTLKKLYQLNNLHKPTIFNGYRDVIKYLQQNKAMGSLFSGFTASLTKTALFIPIYWQILKAWRSTDGSGASKVE